MSVYTPRNSFWSSIPPVTKNLIIINFLLWLAAMLFPGIQDFLGLHYFKSDKFNLLQPVTYMFMHSTRGIGHVFFNMFAVFMFGRLLEQVWGRSVFLPIYLVTRRRSGIIQQITWYIDLIPFMQAVDNYIITGEVGILGEILEHRSFDTLFGRNGFTFPRCSPGCYAHHRSFRSRFGILLGFGMLFPNAPLYIMFIPVLHQSEIYGNRLRCD